MPEVDVTKYEYNNCSTAQAKGPINVIFYGLSATANSVSGSIASRLGWGARSLVGSDSWVNDTYGCAKEDVQQRLGFFHIKHHVRLWNVVGPPQLQIVAADPHIDRRSTHGHCRFNGLPIGDAVPRSYNGHSGYDEGAQEVELAWGGLFTASVGDRYHPDHAYFRQCNGAMVPWNGVIYWINYG